MERKTFSKFDNTVYILGSLSFFGEELKVRCVKSHFCAEAIEINYRRSQFHVCLFYDVNFLSSNLTKLTA